MCNASQAERRPTIVRQSSYRHGESIKPNLGHTRGEYSVVNEIKYVM